MYIWTFLIFNLVTLKTAHIIDDPSLITAPPMYDNGNAVMHDDSLTVQTYIVNDCLFDSVTQSDNYISQNYVDAYIDIFKGCIMITFLLSD